MNFWSVGGTLRRCADGGTGYGYRSDEYAGRRVVHRNSEAAWHRLPMDVRRGIAGTIIYKDREVDVLGLSSMHRRR